MESVKNKIIVSGIQPSGTIHIGNYLGAIKQWVALQQNNITYFCIVDQHAITVPYNNEKLSEHILDTAAAYLAAGIDPKKSTIFIQSHVPAHTELAWLLASTTPLGELSRMTQYKEKSAKQKNEGTLGLFAYPVLQAADILLYKTNTVPVGEDQIQHIELTRDIAKRFNNRFGETFTVPKPTINKETARIMSLTNPTQKMSKSDSPKNYISLTDKPDDIKQKIMSAVTETDPVFSFEKSGPAVKNLLSIYQAFSEEKPEELEAKFKNNGYREFKETLTNLLIDKLAPIQEKYEELRQNESKLHEILEQGAKQANKEADKTLSDVKKKMGLV